MIPGVLGGSILNPDFFETLRTDLIEGRLYLPPMPEVARRIRDCASDPEASAADLAKLISADPTLSGRLLHVANSPYFRGLKPVESVQAAVSRLGMVCVRNLVTSLVMGALFDEIATPAIRRPLREAWEYATRVAAYSFVIARRFTRLSPDEAMLAGLMHNIGIAPILIRASKDSHRMARFQDLLDAADRNHASIGALVAELWALPPKVAIAIAEHEDLTRRTPGLPDLTDVVCVANLHCRLGSRHRLARVDWSAVPAFARLQLTPEQSIAAMREARAQIAEMQQLLQH